MTTVVVLYSTSGGGHLSAARALAGGLAQASCETGHAVDVRLVDYVEHYTTPAVRALPALYSKASRFSALWRGWYGLVAGRRRARAADAVTARIARRRARAFFRDHPADLYVSVHPALNGPVVRAVRDLGPAGARFATVVTDLVTMSPLWFAPEADLCLVPTAEAERLALDCGVPPGRLAVTPYPIAETCFEQTGTAPAAPDVPPGARVVLVVGGAEGVGPIERVVRHLDASPGGPLVVVVVCGRNASLADRLRARTWRHDVRVLGLVDDLVSLLRSADVVLTKAGPATLLEAAATRTPTVVFHRLPGQEEGNVDHVVTVGAAVEALAPAQAAVAARRLLDDPAAQDRMARAQARIVSPGAARAVAVALLRLAVASQVTQVTPIAPAGLPPQRRRRLRRQASRGRAAA